MRKIQFIILITFQFCFSQEDKLKIETNNPKFTPEKYVWTEMTCEKGNKSATNDFKNGVYNFYTYGFTISNDENDKFELFLRNYLKNKYSINYQHKGCVITDESECYQKTMIKLIEEKFGKGFFDKKTEEARKLYSKKEILPITAVWCKWEFCVYREDLDFFNLPSYLQSFG